MDSIKPHQIPILLKSLNIKICSENTDNYIIHCPNPMHDDRRPSCYVDKETGLWFCHSCNSRNDANGKGNMFTLFKLLNRNDLIEKYYKHVEQDMSAYIKDRLTHKRTFKAKKTVRQRYVLPDGCNPVNAKGLGAPYLKYLRLRAIDLPTIKTFKLCYSHNDAVMGKRIIIPVIEQGKLVGYQGRSILKDEPKKYKFVKGMSTKDLLFNIDNCKGYDVILVEGVFDAMTLHQWGYRAAALFGLNINPEKIAKLVRNGVKRVTFCLDGDKPAQLALSKMYRETCPFFNEVYNIHLPDGKDVDDISKREFDKLYRSAHIVKRKEWPWLPLK